ncbi:hypothetical protein Tco_0604022 [Tanacetum coccineum]
MKDLVSTKQSAEEDDGVRMSPRYSALLQNLLPQKENDSGSFILPCSIRRFGELHDQLFKGTNEDDEDLEGIIDYLEPTLYNGFIDSDDEEYKERKCRLLGMPYIKPPLILIEKVNVTRYSIGPREVYRKIKNSGVEKLSKTRGNIATIRAEIINEILKNDDKEESYDETYVLWKPSQDFTRPLGPPGGLNGLLHILNATVIPTKGILSLLKMEIFSSTYYISYDQKQSSREFLVLILLFSIYFTSLMYNRGIVQIK